MKAFEMIKKYTPCFLKAVNSYKGFNYTFWVIGCWILQYPKTFKGGRLVQEGDEVTQDEADQILKDHLTEFELPSGDWSENQKEALLSIMHFIQKETWPESPLCKAIEAGDMESARTEWEALKAVNFEGLDFPVWRDEEIKLFFGVDKKEETK